MANRENIKATEQNPMFFAVEVNYMRNTMDIHSVSMVGKLGYDNLCKHADETALVMEIGDVDELVETLNYNAIDIERYYIIKTTHNDNRL